MFYYYYYYVLYMFYCYHNYFTGTITMLHIQMMLQNTFVGWTLLLRYISYNLIKIADKPLKAIIN